MRTHNPTQEETSLAESERAQVNRLQGALNASNASNASIASNASNTSPQAVAPVQPARGATAAAAADDEDEDAGSSVLGLLNGVGIVAAGGLIGYVALKDKETTVGVEACISGG